MSRLLDSSGRLLLDNSGDVQLYNGSTGGCCGCFNASGCTCTTVTHANGSTYTIHPTISGMMTWTDVEPDRSPTVPAYTLGPYTFDLSSNAYALNMSGGSRDSVTPGKWVRQPSAGYCTWTSSAYVGYTTFDGSGEQVFHADTVPSNRPGGAIAQWFDFIWNFNVDGGGHPTNYTLEIIGSAASFGYMTFNGVSANTGGSTLIISAGSWSCSDRASTLTNVGVAFNPNLTNP